MKEKNAIGWFEIPAKDLVRAKAFYEHVFEVRLENLDFGPLKMAMFPMQPEGIGAAGSLVQGETYVPSHSGSMVYFMVEDIEGTLGRVAERGGKVLNPKMNIGQYGFVGHFEDSEGNRVALHSMT